MCEATKSLRSPPPSGRLPCCRCRRIRMFRLRPVAGAERSQSRPRRHPGLPDGTVNLGRVPGEKGVWNLPYITNMGARVIDPATNKPFPLVANVGPAGKPVGGRGGAPAEPFVPFQPWAAAMYNYNTMNSSKYDPEGLLPPSRRAAPLCDALPGGIHPDAGQVAHLHRVRGRRAHLAGNLHGRPASPDGRCPAPHVAGPFSRQMGRRHARRRRRRFPRRNVARLLWPPAYRQASRRGEVLASEQGDAALRSAHRRSRGRTPGRSPLPGTSISMRTTSSPSTSARRTTASCSG